MMGKRSVQVWFLLGVMANACLADRPPVPPATGLLDRAVDWALLLSRRLRSEDWLIPIPGFGKPFVQGLIKGEVAAGGGYFGDFGSLERLGPVRAAMNGSTLSLGADFALADFRVGYNNYTVRFGGTTASGEVALSVSGNRLRLAADADLLRPWCSLYVSLSLADVTGPEIRVLRLGEFNGLMDLLTDWAVSVFAGRLVGRANLGLRGLSDRLSRHC